MATEAPDRRPAAAGPPGRPSARASSRALAANLALSAASIVIVLGLAEGLCRLFDREPPPRPVASYITVWNDGEFYTVKSAATGWPPWEDYNRDGMRDREHALGKPPGAWRVMVLGDSVTLGYGLRPEQAFPQVLQDLLDARGLGAEVFNVAFSGWSTRQERIAYERIGRKYHPDDVLVAVCLNDIPEIHNNLTRPPAWVRALYARSALARTLVGARRHEIHDVEELFAQPESPTVRDAFARFAAELRALRAEVTGDGARFGVVVFPFRLQVAPGARAPVVQARIAALCAAEHIPVLDLLSSLRALGDDGFLDYDHLSAAGARLVAEVLAESPLLDAAGRETVAVAPAAGGAAGGVPAAQWIARLRAADAATRIAAARALGTTSAEAATAVPALTRALGDADPSVRAAVAWALGGYGPAAAPAIPALTDALRDMQPSLRAGAAHTLGATGAAARNAAPALVPLLADPAEEVRWRAEDALVSIGPDPRTCLPLLIPLVAERSGPGRGPAAAVIGRMGPSAAAAVPVLTAALEDARADVRWKAAWALGQIGAEARGAVPALIAMARDPEVGWHALDALGAIGPEARAAVPMLIASLGDASSNVRWRATLALGHIGPDGREAAALLARLLRDPADNVRLAAAHALGRVDPPLEAAARALAQALRGDADSRVRAAAAVSLARLPGGVERTLDALLAAARDPDPLVRADAVRALARATPTPAVSAVLGQALQDGDAGVRAEAARAARGHRTR